MNNHRVQFYDSDTFLVKTVSAFIDSAQRAGNRTIIIATRNHLEALRAIVGPAGIGPDAPDDCVWLDAHDTLARIMVGGLPDEQRLDDVVGAWLQRVSGNGSRRPVSAFSEMIAVLYGEGSTEAALRLERSWGKLAQSRCFDLLCAYPLNLFADDGHRDAFQYICAAHSHVNPPEWLDTRNDPDTFYRTVALLQQRANALDSERRCRKTLERLLEAQMARITAMASAVAELEHLASQDDLTGLYNKRVFTDRLTHAVERAARSGNSLALIFIDLDGFKALNDRRGHIVGDCLLRQVATRLRLCARAADTVCRWGGDEFAVIAEDADATHAHAFAQRIALALRQSFVLDDISIAVTASVGFSLFPDDASDVQGLVHNADAAMYRAKRIRNGCESAECATAGLLVLPRQRSHPIQPPRSDQLTVGTFPDPE